jgi:L-alanine-DL-glutamate epimerase-like enolase superfamily enzyme
MILNKPKVEKGWIDVPQGPGFDIKLDWDQIEKYRQN